MTKQEFLKLVEEEIVILDGATGSNLIKRGMPHDVCTEVWVSEHRDTMIQLQKEYIACGSRIIYAPTFSGNRIKLKTYGLVEQIQELNHNLVEISIEAAQGKALVAGDITMTGAQLEPMGDMTFDELVDIYKEQITYLVEAGIDLLVIETMMSLQETRAAVLAAREACELPVMATLSFHENGMTLYGVAAQSAVVVLQGMGVDAVGLNCSAGPDKMMGTIKDMKQYATVPLIAKPNAGLPKLKADGSTDYDMEAEVFKQYMEGIVQQGVGMIGGCCGTNPDYIKELSKMAKKKPPLPIDKQKEIYLASEREVFKYSPGTKLEIFTDIDFSKEESLVDEYKEDTFDTLYELADEIEDTVDIIRIFTKAEGVDEKEALLAVANELTRIVGVPLLISSDSVEVIEYVVRHFSGIMAIEENHNLKEWETQIKSIARSYQVPVVTIDKKIIYC